MVDINTLRNKIWHQGVYILPYDTLDDYVGKNVLPLIKNICQLSDYKRYKKKWEYGYIACGIDPLNEIIDLYDSINDFSDKKHLNKTAYLKELGRAAYLNIINEEEWENREQQGRTGLQSGFSWLYRRKFDKKRYIALKVSDIEKSVEEGSYYYIDKYDCPVCGLNTLIEYKQHLDADEMDYKHIYYEWTKEVKCSCCGFNVDDSLGNAQKLGLKLDNYFDE